MKYLRTSDLARTANIHPNTVRRYIDWGLLPPVDRTPSGYRRFTQRHLDCLRLVRQIYNSPFAGRAIHQTGIRIIRVAVGGDWGGALEIARHRLALVQLERAEADAAAELLERWASGAATESASEPLRIGQVAKMLGVSIDIVRNWDRNGLIVVPRDPSNGYRRYGGQEISRLRVIRMLSTSGYSTSAILRMLIQLDRGETTNLRLALDTPRPDEDVYTASDRWISNLTDQEQRARATIALIEEIIGRKGGSR